MTRVRLLAPLCALLCVCWAASACVVSSGATPTPRSAADAASPVTTPALKPTVTIEPDGSEVIVAPPNVPRPHTSGAQTLTLAGAPNGPLTLDPALLRDADAAFLARQIFRGLVSLDDDLEPQPELAERIEVSADGLRYTFELRANAVFHNGAPITAQAVADSLNRACDPALDTTGGGLPAATYLGDIAGADARLAGHAATLSGLRVLDARTLEITLAHPTADFLFKLAGPPAEVVDVASATGADWWRHPNGSGPFTLQPYSPGNTMTLRGFARFYRGAPALTEVRVLGGNDAAQPLNLYEANKLDMTDTPFDSIDRVSSPADPLHADLVVVPQLSTTFLVLNPNVAPFDNRDVRLAIVHAFDREKEVRVALESRVDLADGLVPPGIGGRDWPADLPDYKLDEARQLLLAAGPVSVRPTIYEPGAGIAATVAAVLQRDLGLQAQAVDVPWDQFSGLLTDKTLPAYVLSWIADYPDPENFLASMFVSTSPDNYLGYANPQVDALLAQAEREPDANRRADLYLQAQQLIINDGVLLPLYHEVAYTLIKPWVRGLTVTSIGVLSLESVWIER